MQLSKITNKTANRGVLEKHYYEVSNSPKVMQMLSDFLYSDKVLAPVRELTTNAIDAHVEAGTTDKPIKFFLPTFYDDTPVFRIRDYGTGMPEEKLVQLYRIYGLSDKSDTNEFSGCLGLGSKSPFCLTDSFTTISYYNGKRYIYVNSKSNNGVPTLNKISEDNTNEPNGLEVSFNIETCQVNELKQKLAKVLKRCPIPFECSPELKVEQEKKTILLEGDGWRLFSESGTPKAIMGYIEYPIERSYWSSHNNHSSLLNLNIELDFKIGEIEMDIGRENLQYNDLTKRAISVKLDEINSSLFKLIEEKVNAAECLYDARLLLDQFKTKFPWITVQVHYKGNFIDSFDSISENLRTKNEFEGVFALYKYYGGIKFKGRMNFWNLFRGRSKIGFVSDNLSNSVRGRTKQLIRKNPNDYDLVLVFPNKISSEVVGLFGIPESRIIKASDLPKVDRAPRTTTANKSYSAKVLKKGEKFWENCNIAKKLGPQHYIKVLRQNCWFLGKMWHTNNISIILDLAEKNGINTPNNIYFVIPSKIEIVKKWGWIEYSDVLTKEYEKIANNVNCKKAYLADLKNTESNIFSSFLTDSSYYQLSNGLLKKYLRLLKFIDKCHSNNKINDAIRFRKYFVEEELKSSLKINLEEVEKRIFRRYPLLSYWKYDYYKFDRKTHPLIFDDFVSYVSMVDRVFTQEKK